MRNKEFGHYLYRLRMKSGATTVSEYLRRKSLNISEQFYRALENGDKLPAIESINELASALNSDPYALFQYYLEEVLPPAVFKKLVNPVNTEVAIESPKEALDEKELALNSLRASLRKHQSDISDNVYRSDDVIVDFLTDHIEWLPLIHYIYSKESAASEEELRRVCKLNNIDDDLDSILSEFSDLRIANVIVKMKGKTKQRFVRRFNRAFRLPSTLKGRALREQWIQLEVTKSIHHERQSDRVDSVQPEKTFSFAMIDCYQMDKLARINDRITDLIAELHSAGTHIDHPDSQTFFVYLTLSPRPEYGEASSGSKYYQSVTG